MKIFAWAMVGLVMAVTPACVSLSPARPKVCADCVKANMETLAGPALRGRGCGTEDEHAAARFLEGRLKAYGVKGGLPGGGYLQEVKFTPRGQTEARTTYNVIGAIPGKAKAGGAILLSAHYDHLGVRNGVVFPGANDDASGTAAVLEFARLLAKGKRPQRTVQFALFGCEEAGGHGARYYVNNPPIPLADLAANLEFEMIGLPDPKRPKTLMLTGWERSNLGPSMAARGAEIGPDLYPEQNFFRRSDNYQLALKGVVAQTVSAWPTPPTYHKDTDTIANLDLAFMAEVIQSMVEPVDWLLNSDFKPEWNAGMKP